MIDVNLRQRKQKPTQKKCLRPESEITVQFYSLNCLIGQAFLVLYYPSWIRYYASLSGHCAFP